MWTELQKNQKVVIKDMPGQVMTVVNPYPDERTRVTVQDAKGTKYRRASASIRKLNKSDLTIINAYNSIMRF